MELSVWNNVTNEWPKYLAFGLLTLGIALLTGILTLSRQTFAQPYLGNIRLNPAGFFEPFLGKTSPLLAVALLAVLGLAGLVYLQSRGWFEIYIAQENLRGVVVSAYLATLLGVEVVMVETANLIRMPADMNVPLPWATLFYPVIAYVVEIVFHVLPLTLLLTVLSLFFKNPDYTRLVWTCIFVVSLLEPVFQTLSGQPILGTQVYVGLHVWAINLLQLYVFWRYGFVPMYAFRAIYYLYWHILWGALRLQLLF